MVQIECPRHPIHRFPHSYFQPSPLWGNKNWPSQYKSEKVGKFRKQNWLKGVQMFQFECPWHWNQVKEWSIHGFERDNIAFSIPLRPAGNRKNFFHSTFQFQQGKTETDFLWIPLWFMTFITCQIALWHIQHHAYTADKFLTLKSIPSLMIWTGAPTRSTPPPRPAAPRPALISRLFLPYRAQLHLLLRVYGTLKCILLFIGWGISLFQTDYHVLIVTEVCTFMILVQGSNCK